MEKLTLKLSEKGKQIDSSPSEGGRLNLSFINYHSGIPELDDYLKNNNKEFKDLNAEFGAIIYSEVVTFLLYRSNKAFWEFTISRSTISEVKSFHEQNLNIRKDSKVSGGVLGAISAMGIVGGIVAGTVDALTSDKNNASENTVLGSIFEIVTKNEAELEEKIILSCTNKKRVIVEQFLNKVVLIS